MDRPAFDWACAPLLAAPTPAAGAPRANSGSKTARVVSPSSSTPGRRSPAADPARGVAPKAGCGMSGGAREAEAEVGMLAGARCRQAEELGSAAGRRMARSAGASGGRGWAPVMGAPGQAPPGTTAHMSAGTREAILEPVEVGGGGGGWGGQ